MAGSRRIFLTFVPMLALCFAVGTSGRAESKAGTDSPKKVAKLPEQSPEVPATDRKEATPAAPPLTEGQRQVAMLSASPRSRTAAEMLDRGLDFGFYNDPGGERACLEESAALAPGSWEAGTALVLLGATYIREGNTAEGCTLMDQAKREVADPEVQAFAHVVRSYSVAMLDRDLETVVAVLASAADAQRGTFVGGHAALQLGDTYRFQFDDYVSATAIFQQVLDDYATGPTAEEARVALAECEDWGHGDRFAAIALYEEALENTTIPRLRLRALAGLGDCLREVRESRAALAVFSQLLEYDRDRPAAKLALAFRAAIADQFGDKEMAAADARAYLATGNMQPLWRAKAHEILGKCAFQQGRIDDAQREFEAMLPHADRSRAGARYSGVARAGIARCNEARGEMTNALSMMLQAADRTAMARHRCLYLYQAAEIAQRAGDAASVTSIVDRMVEEFPGSHLTTRLLGHEVLPPPEI